MEYTKYFPENDSEKAIVECYYCWKGHASSRIEIQSPPTGFAALVIISSDPYLAWQHEEPKQIVPNAFVCGLFTSNYHLSLLGDVDAAGVVLKPSALYNLFGIRMSTLVNNRMPLELLPDSDAALLANAVKQENTNQKKVSILRSFLMDRFNAARERFTIVEDIIRWIDQHHGNVTIDEVAAKFRVSRRYVETRFLEKVGVSPKFYARIRRFSYLSNIIVRAKDLNWQDVVHLGGFHDQSHLVKEFLKFNKMSPAEYIDNHKELIRLVKPKPLRNFTMKGRSEG